MADNENKLPLFYWIIGVAMIVFPILQAAEKYGALITLIGLLVLVGYLYYQYTKQK